MYTFLYSTVIIIRHYTSVYLQIFAEQGFHRFDFNPIHPTARMNPENTNKLMGFYMEAFKLILDVNTMYMLFCFFKLFLIGCMGLNPPYKIT